MPLHFRNGFRHNYLLGMKLTAAGSPCTLRMPQTQKPSDFRGSRVRTSEKRTGIGYVPIPVHFLPAKGAGRSKTPGNHVSVAASSARH